MGIKNNVFASKSERENYYKLVKVWGKNYHIYHNLPFLNVFSIKHLPSVKVNDIEFNRLKKTSIDYTLCTKQDEPLICIEFDGLQEGFNIGPKYISEIPFSPWRKEFMELKLRVAHDLLFPFFVVGSPLFKKISENLNSTVLDGIIGNIIASKKFNEIYKNRFARKDFQYQKLEANIGLDPYLKLSIDFKKKNNPIYKKWHEFMDFFDPYKYQKNYFKYHYYQHPKKVDYEKVTHLGMEVIVYLEGIGSQKAKVWIPKFNTHGDDLSMGNTDLLEKISLILAVDKIINSKNK